MSLIKVNGVTTHYCYIKCAKTGNSHRTIVFINSLGTDFRIWDEVAEILSGHGNILLYDKRGHGLSDMVVGTMGLVDYMQDLVALLKKLFVTECTIVGLSIGGMIAQLLAYYYPRMIDKLILCDTGRKIGTRQAWYERIAAVRENGLQIISGGVMERWFSESFRINEPDKVSGYRNMLERTPVNGYIQACEAIRDADLALIAKQLKIPSMCIVGSEDKSTTPAEVKNLADLIRGVRFEIIQGSGHLPCVDNPKALSNLMIDFIK